MIDARDMSNQSPLNSMTTARQTPGNAMTTVQLAQHAAEFAALAKMAGSADARNEFNRLARRYAALIAERDT